MKKMYALFVVLFLAKFSFAQPPTLPLPYTLATGNYSFTSWDPASPQGTYPANMVFHYTFFTDSPYYNHLTEGTRNYDCPYNLTSRNRILGRGDSGIAFLTTSSAQYNDCSGTVKTADTNRYVGDAVLGINSLGKTGVQVEWTGYFLIAGDGSGNPDSARQGTIRLQYRIGATGNYTDVVNGTTDTVEFRTTGKTINTALTLNATLPTACDNQALVYLRWVYFTVPVATGSKGSRPEIGLDDITVGTGILPVHLLSFGIANSNGAAALSWKTTNEVSFSHFEVERSSNGGSYSTIASVGAKGSGNNTYNLIDAKAASGNHLYRLKMVNTDGSFSYSGVVSFTTKAAGVLSITPNPVADKFTLSHPQASSNAMITIFGFDGKKVASYAVAANAVQTSLNAGNLSKGNYLLLFTNGNQRLTVKLAKN